MLNFQVGKELIDVHLSFKFFLCFFFIFFFKILCCLFSDSRAELEMAIDAYVPEGGAGESEPEPEPQLEEPSTSVPKPTNRSSVSFLSIVRKFFKPKASIMENPANTFVQKTLSASYICCIYFR